MALIIGHAVVLGSLTAERSVTVPIAGELEVAFSPIPALINLIVIASVLSIAMAAIFGGGMHHWDMGRWWVR